MSDVPKHLKYTAEHEWLAFKAGVARVGITDHAQEQLGDIVYLGDLPDVGDTVEKDDVIGVVESVKATSEIYAPIRGKIVEVNEALDEEPELVNGSPYGDGWILAIKPARDADLEGLLDAAEYQQLLEQ